MPALIRKQRGEGEQEIFLRLLEHVGEDATLTQSKFADRVGIAKGLANAYFNRCLKKGWIKLRHAPRQRYLYYLTPKGFSEKARLTAQFLALSFQFYQEARKDLVSAMNEARADGHHRLAILGDGEFAEIAAVVSGEVAIDIAGFVGLNGRDRIAGFPVVRSLGELDEVDAALLAAVNNPKLMCNAAREDKAGIAIYVPEKLSALLWE